MGENVLEYDGVLLDEGEDDPYFEDGDCSSSEDEFLEIPLNDRFFYKHWKLLEKIKSLFLPAITLTVYFPLYGVFYWFYLLSAVGWDI